MSKNASSVDYGYDAPGVMLGLLAGGASVLVTGMIFLLAAKPQWLHWAGAILAIIALVLLVLGISMFLYGIKGKIRTRNFLLRQTAWNGDERVLDIGTGAGLMAIGAAKLLSTGRVVGVDIWSARDLTNNGMASAERNVHLEGMNDRISIQTGDARQLAFETSYFDRVLSLLCLHNIKDKAEQVAACTEISRVLKPGGYAIIGDYVPVDAYATALHAAGLRIVQKKSGFGIALSLMFYLVAEKPRNG